MSSADFLNRISQYHYWNSLLGRSSRSLGLKFFPFVGFCLIYCKRVRLNFGLYAIHCSLTPRYSALYQVSVRQNANSADGFLQILPHDRHPCHSLTLPINTACTGTCTLPVKELCPTYNRVGRGIAPPPSHTTVRTYVHGGFLRFVNLEKFNARLNKPCSANHCTLIAIETWGLADLRHQPVPDSASIQLCHLSTPILNRNFCSVKVRLHCLIR